ncbi:MAG: hypothetical protein ACOY31_05275 [Bacillota bacterium]
MNKNRVIPVIVVLAGVLLFGAALAGAAGAGDPGSASDPLVTKSYIDARVNELVKEKVDSALKDYKTENTSSWEVVNLSPGQRVECEAGTELIVRAGTTLVVDPVGSGIPDVTEGSNIRAGKKVALDHLLIIPRTDGRGVDAQSKAIIMYRGKINLTRYGL